MKDIFYSAALKLTGWYLIIIMALSLGASIALYRVSSAELQHNVSRQIGYYNGFLAPSDVFNYTRLREGQLEQDRDHLKANLLFFNLVVLLAGGAASYALARRTLRPIEESHEAQARFAGDASHELRTPLTAMQSEIEVALRDPALTKKEAVDLLGSNLEEVIKLRTLAEGLLRLSRSSDKPADFEQAVSVKDVVDEAMERVSKMAAAKKITIESGAQDLSVRGNHQHLVDLLAILLDNAIKYSPAHSAVNISTAASEKRVRITIKDHGQGIDAKDLPLIFDRFYRADSSRSKTNAGGYGLGLALAKKIADLHDGAIEVKSASGKGSTFTIVLPAA